MRYASICSGIGSCRLALPKHWECEFFAEIDPFPSAVLAHHWPHTPNVGDFTEVMKSEQAQTVGLVVGGTPCQSFSIAGERGGMADQRGSLAVQHVRLARHLRAKWILWENVPGVFSSNGGRDFALLLHTLAEHGYGFAWRVLDAQYFGVPQRRRRVFLVGYHGDWRPPAAVLFEPAGLRRHTPQSRTTRAHTAGTLTASLAKGGISNTEGVATANHIVSTLQARHSVNSEGAAGGHLQVMATGQGGAEVRSGSAPTLTCNHEAPIAFDTSQITNPGNRANPQPGNPCHTITAGGHTPKIADRSQVRRLTPLECERLQGLPENHTAVPFKGRAVAADGHRYKAIGNGFAVPVVRWLGQRIEAVQQIIERGPR